MKRMKELMSLLSFWLFMAGIWGVAWLLVFKVGVRLPNMLTRGDLDGNQSFIGMLMILASLVPVVALVVWAVVSETLKNWRMRKHISG